MVAAAAFLMAARGQHTGRKGFRLAPRKQNPRHAAGGNKDRRRPEALPARARILSLFRYSCRRPPTRVVMQMPREVNPKRQRRAVAEALLGGFQFLCFFKRLSLLLRMREKRQPGLYSVYICVQPQAEVKTTFLDLGANRKRYHLFDVL